MEQNMEFIQQIINLTGLCLQVIDTVYIYLFATEFYHPCVSADLPKPRQPLALVRSGIAPIETGNYVNTSEMNVDVPSDRTRAISPGMSMT